jgi:hypothetical protein
MANRSARIEGVYARVDHQLHLGYSMNYPPQVCTSQRMVTLQFTIDGLKKVRQYDITLEKEE